MGGFLHFLFTLHSYLLSDTACKFYKKIASSITAAAPGTPIIPTQTAVMGFIPTIIPYFCKTIFTSDKITHPAKLFKRKSNIYFPGASYTKKEHKMIRAPKIKPTRLTKLSN